MEVVRTDEAAAAVPATAPAKTGKKKKEDNDEAEEAKSAALPDEADAGDEDSEEDDVSVLTDGGAEADDGVTPRKHPKQFLARIRPTMDPSVHCSASRLPLCSSISQRRGCRPRLARDDYGGKGTRRRRHHSRLRCRARPISSSPFPPRRPPSTSPSIQAPSPTSHFLNYSRAETSRHNST